MLVSKSLNFEVRIIETKMHRYRIKFNAIMKSLILISTVLGISIRYGIKPNEKINKYIVKTLF